VEEVIFVVKFPELVVTATADVTTTAGDDWAAVDDVTTTVGVDCAAAIRG